MDRQEAVQKLATAGRLSIAHAEDLYDSFFEKPVVPQYVADWYEENKDYFEVSLFQCIGEVVKCYNRDSSSKFEDWLISMDVDALTTLVNMHQFGYEVEKEKRYKVKMKNLLKRWCTLNRSKKGGFIFSDSEPNSLYDTEFTRQEIEEAGFGEVFNSPLFEVEEVE